MPQYLRGIPLISINFLHHVAAVARNLCHLFNSVRAELVHKSRMQYIRHKSGSRGAAKAFKAELISAVATLEFPALYSLAAYV